MAGRAYAIKTITVIGICVITTVIGAIWLGTSTPNIPSERCSYAHC
jgi:amino acid transporter